jgi:CheY-like chemotaxis protein
LPDGLPPVAADKGQLETVLVNLATNARDAMPDGGRLTVTAEPETVAERPAAHPAGLAPGRYVRLVIADTGSGMDQATLARAREPFFTTKPAGAGTGLGLPMAVGFAEQSGGALLIESRPGEGTTVSLWLPRAEPCDRGSEEVADSGTGRRSARILVVDDEDLVREVIARQIEDAGYRVEVAAGADDALALLAAGAEVDAVVTDLSMPGMDGLALLRSVRDRFPALPAILLTGYADAATAVSMEEHLNGNMLLLRKPVAGAELLSRLGALLARDLELTG